jgi:hypothetical protein
MDEPNEDELARRVAEAAERGYPGDRNAQVREVAKRAAAFGIGVTLRALLVIAERPDVREHLIRKLPET